MQMFDFIIENTLFSLYYGGFREKKLQWMPPTNEWTFEKRVAQVAVAFNNSRFMIFDFAKIHDSHEMSLKSKPTEK